MLGDVGDVRALLTSAGEPVSQQLIQSLQTQVDQIEAPKQPVSSNFEAVEVDPEPKQEESEQGTGEQEVASAKDHNPKKGLLGRLFS